MSIQRRGFLILAGCASALAGCTGLAREGGNEEGGGDSDDELVVATTTSTYDTGLLDELNAAFEERFGAAVKTVARGTGAALRTARDGDCDVVLVHARELEDEFLRDGYGVNRRDVMENSFVVVGPPADPAEIRNEEVTDAFARIADAGAPFVSRGDGSGTHVKEREIWESAGIEPGGEWYTEAGQGMGNVLVQADQRDAYTLADSGTYLSMRSRLDSTVLVGGGGELLANPYGIIPVDPAVHEDAAYELAMAYVGFLTGPEGQGIVADYAVDGERLFSPLAASVEPNFAQYVPEGWSGDEEGADPA